MPFAPTLGSTRYGQDDEDQDEVYLEEVAGVGDRDNDEEETAAGDYTNVMRMEATAGHSSTTGAALDELEYYEEKYTAGGEAEGEADVVDHMMGGASPPKFSFVSGAQVGGDGEAVTAAGGQRDHRHGAGDTETGLARAVASLRGGSGEEQDEPGDAEEVIAELAALVAETRERDEENARLRGSVERQRLKSEAVRAACTRKQAENDALRAALDSRVYLERDLEACRSQLQSAQTGGAPGAGGDSSFSLAALIISDLRAEGPAPPTIVVCNRTNADVSLAGWSLKPTLSHAAAAAVSASAAATFDWPDEAWLAAGSSCEVFWGAADDAFAVRAKHRPHAGEYGWVLGDGALTVAASTAAAVAAASLGAGAISLVDPAGNEFPMHAPPPLAAAAAQLPLGAEAPRAAEWAAAQKRWESPDISEDGASRLKRARIGSELGNGGAPPASWGVRSLMNFFFPSSDAAAATA